MVHETEAKKQHLFLNISCHNSSIENKKTCINCQKNRGFSTLDCDSFKDLNLVKNVENLLHENQKKFLYMMQEIICLCKQNNNS